VLLESHSLIYKLTSPQLSLFTLFEGYANISFMIKYKFTPYFENEVLRKRPYLKKEWCVRVIEDPIKSEKQEDNRYRFWGAIEELNMRILRVVTLEDRTTIHNAFLDRSFRP
jgi:hypothetical protein